MLIFNFITVTYGTSLNRLRGLYIAIYALLHTDVMLCSSSSCKQELALTTVTQVHAADGGVVENVSTELPIWKRYSVVTDRMPYFIFCVGCVPSSAGVT
jgi:hypothetical protein